MVTRMVQLLFVPSLLFSTSRHTSMKVLSAWLSCLFSGTSTTTRSVQARYPSSSRIQWRNIGAGDGSTLTTSSCFITTATRRRRKPVSFALSWSSFLPVGRPSASTRVEQQQQHLCLPSQRVLISSRRYMSATSRTTTSAEELSSSNATISGMDGNNDHLEEKKKYDNEIDLELKKQNLFQQVLGIDFSKLELKMPKSLSPSAALEFQSCPQSYLMQYLLGIKQPTTDVLAKGSLIHKALEKIYDLSPSERSLDTLQNLFRQEWSDKRLSDEYQHLFRKRHPRPHTIHNITKEELMLMIQEGEELVFADDDEEEVEEEKEDERDINAERTWGEESLRLLENYVEMENPSDIKNILRREVWVMSKLNVTTEDEEELSSLLVRGIVDRLDLVFVNDDVDPLEQMMSMDSNNVSLNGDGDQDGKGINYFASNPKNNGGGVLRITDYKTGKAPTFQYSREVNERIANEKFWQLKVYALLLQKMMSENKGRLPKNYPVRYLRLLYLTSDTGQAQYLEMDLGSSEEERLWELYQIKQELIDLWCSIQRLVDTQNLKAFEHCNRNFCWCHKVRPYVPQGILWERTSPSPTR